MRFIARITLACAFLAPIAAHATNFTFTGTFTNSTALTGTFTLDGSGNLTAASITGAPKGVSITFNNPYSNGGFGGLTVEKITDTSSTYVLDFILPANFTGGAVCSDSSLCKYATQGYSTYFENYPGQIDLLSGTATIVGNGTPPPTAAAPEPSSLALLGTSLIGLTGAVRRRLRKN